MRPDPARLPQLAAALRERARSDAALSELIGRPALLGHLGEYIAAAVFDIELEASGSQRRFDGRFRRGPLAGRTVNVKWYARREGILDLHDDEECEFYLVLAGPTATLPSRPWVIEAAYLFDNRELLEALRAAGTKIGVATGVRASVWEEAEIFPRPNNPAIELSPAQIEMLRQFSTKDQTPGPAAPTLQALSSALARFARARDWEQFHGPKNLVMALSAEVGELIEIFQWLTAEQSTSLPAEDRERAEEEIADVQIYLLRLADVLGIDVGTAVLRKIELNEQKYPAEKARGSAKKYSELG